jgi:hypothetical protein
MAGFLVIVFDRTERTFSVEGPIRDDRLCREMITRGRSEGRDVDFVSYLDGPARRWRRSAAERFRKVSKFERVAIGSILGTDLRKLGEG